MADETGNSQPGLSPREHLMAGNVVSYMVVAQKLDHRGDRDKPLADAVETIARMDKANPGHLDEIIDIVEAQARERVNHA